MNLLQKFTYSITVVCLFSCAAIAAEPSLRVDGPAKIVQGFPSIFKLTVTGPAKVEKISLERPAGALRIDFASEGCQAFSIARPSPVEGLDIPLVAALEAGSTTIPAGESRIILLDLHSLFRLPLGTNLDDIPAGNYRVSVTLQEARFQPSTLERPLLRSNEITIAIGLPTPAELKLIESIKNDQNAMVKFGEGVDWSKVLSTGMDLAQYEWKNATSLVRQQAGLHLFMSLFLSGRLNVDSRSIAAAQTEPLPSYLEPEREALVVELRHAAGLSSSQELAQIIERSPELKGRANEITRSRFVDKVRSMAKSREQK